MDNEGSSDCDKRCCPITAFSVLLVFAFLFMTMYAIIHGTHVHIILHVFGVQGAFGGVYIILIADIICSTLGILACICTNDSNVENTSKWVLAIVYVILTLNCIANAFVGIFITTGIKKIYALPKLKVGPQPFSSKTPNIDCKDNKKDEDCRALSMFAISLYVLYLQLLIRIIVLIGAKGAFCLGNYDRHRPGGSLGFLYLRRSGQGQNQGVRASQSQHQDQHNQISVEYSNH